MAEPLITLPDHWKRALLLCAHGLTNQAIADQMYVCEWTARHYLERVGNKLGTSGRMATVIVALQHNIITLDEIHIERNRC